MHNKCAISFIFSKVLLLKSLNKHFSFGQHVKKYLSGLDNRKVLCAPGPKKKYFERIFCRSIKYNNNEVYNFLK